MALRETDEVVKRRPQRRHWTERWLREIFLEDLGLKLLALLISVALWYGVTGQRTPTTIRVPRVPLNFRLPGGTEISNEARTEVEVTLTGNKRDLDKINVRDLTVNVDATDLTPGEHYLQLTPERVTMGLPDGVRFGDLQPNNVQLKVEPRVERELEVEVRRSGNLPEGYELLGISATPDKVKVRGPASHVDQLQKAPTAVISLDGRRESFTQPQTHVEIADKKVDLLDTVVSVRFEIEERKAERSFSGVAVEEQQASGASPRTAALTISGPRSLVERLRPEELRLALDAAEDGSPRPRLILPAEAQGKVELRSYKISGFFK